MPQIPVCCMIFSSTAAKEDSPLPSPFSLAIVKKIAENDRHQTYSRLTSNKIFVLYEIPFLLGQKEKESHRLNYLKDNLLVNTKVTNGRKILFLDPLILLPRLLRIFRRPEVNHGKFLAPFECGGNIELRACAKELGPILTRKS